MLVVYRGVRGQDLWEDCRLCQVEAFQGPALQTAIQRNEVQIGILGCLSGRAGYFDFELCFSVRNILKLQSCHA